MRPRFAIALSVVVILLLANLEAAGSDDIVQVRVPASKVSSWFPVGTEFEVLRPDQFDALHKAASERTTPSKPPRILKATHSARWEAGVLVGRSNLTFEASGGAGPRLVVLEPWSPALDVPEDGLEVFRALEDGRLAARIEASTPRTIEVNWKLRARPGSDGLAFALALPDLDVSALTLELPNGWIPEAKAGIRVGPTPGTLPDRATWRFEGSRGLIELRLRDPAAETGEFGAPRLWIEGTTRIDLNQVPTNWRADWTLDESPGSPQIVTVELDPGLELVEVSGPRVASFREESAGLSTRVKIKLDGPGSGQSPLIIKGIARAPAEGPWAVPSARPIDAMWIGGRTLVTLDSSRVLRACQERSGRRVPPRPGDPFDVTTLVFEGKGEAGPVAELTFREPTVDATVDIRGHLILGDEAPRIEVALTWMVERGRLSAHAVDLAPGWVAEGVFSSVKQPVPWHADRLGNGGTRVHIGPPLPDENALLVTLTLFASNPKAGVTGLLDLPRVRPAAGVRVVDEIWAATPSPNLSLRPIKGEGLAWIDPLDPPLDDAPSPWVADDLKNALAWRWLADDAEGRINRTMPQDRPRAEVQLDATIRGKKLELAWSLAIDPDLEMIRSIPIHLDPPVDPAILWRSKEVGGPIVEARPIDEARRAKLGFPSTGSAWDLELSGAIRVRTSLQGVLDRPWEGRGPIPILSLPESFRTRGLVTVVVDDATRVKLQADRLTPIDPSAHSPGSTSPEMPGSRASESRTRRAALYAYQSVGGRLQIETSDVPAGISSGFIREAFLVSQVFPGEGVRNRLSLKIAGLSRGSISLKMPGGTQVDRLSRDGLAVAGTPEAGGAFRVEIFEDSGSRLDTSLTIDYRTEAPGLAHRIEPAKLLPECSLACLSFVWELVVPDPWIVSDDAQGLIATDPRASRSLTSRLLGFATDPWTRTDRSAQASDQAMLADLDRVAGEFAGTEMSLSDWLLKLDGGRWPLVVDRLTLRSSGWGPGSRVSLATPEMKSLGPVKGILQPLGLVAVPLSGMILITSRLEFPERPADRQAWAEKLRKVPGDGSDLNDRFQSVARWRGEATPRALASGESPERPPGSGGWRCWRLVASNWPPPEASVGLMDSRADQARGWMVASILLAGGIVARKRPAKSRGIALALLGIGVTIALAWTWPEPPSWATGWLRGVAAIAAFWGGRSLRKPVEAVSVEAVTGSVPTRRSGLLPGVGSAILAVVLAGSWALIEAASSLEDLPILALLVFDGPPDATAKPDRVVLSLADAARLRLLARPRPVDGRPVVSLASASHSVSKLEANVSTVESDFEVEVEAEPGERALSWSMPVGKARDLSATVDGRSTPLRISSDGLSANVLLDGPGRHSIIFRRSIPLKDLGPDGSRLSMPINRAAFARVVVEKGDGSNRLTVPSALGTVETSDRKLEVGLGPVENLEIAWTPSGRVAVSGLPGSVDATLLWEARAVGDLIRVRLAHADPEGASTVRLILEPGAIVRRHSIPNVVRVRQEGTAEAPEWVAIVDPPLPKDVPIVVDLWRSVTPGMLQRRWPSVGVVATGKVITLLGLRRPEGWTGRLDPAQQPGVETVAEATFAKAWGPLDETEGLAMAGAVRFGSTPPLSVAIRPIPARRLIESKVRLDLVSGRLEVGIDATLTDLQGRSFELELGLPNDLKLIRVEAVGLVDWQKLARGRLRLQFDGSEVQKRPILIVGSLPVPSDSVMTEARSFQARIPWPRWFDSDSSAGTLTVTGPTRFQVEGGEGVVSLTSTGPTEKASDYRSTYRVDRPEVSSTIRWSAPPARLLATVRSDLTIDPVSMLWSVAVNCEIAGGPADSLQWYLPTDWARTATLEIVGHPHRLVAEPKGVKGETTRWTILPESPLWGRVKLILKASRPIEPGVLIAYPEIIPLAVAGRGSVERYELTLSNVSGREVKREGLKGLQTLDVSRVRPDDSLGPPGSIDHAYQINGSRWSLGLIVGPGDEPGTSGGESRASRVTQASIVATVENSGGIWGRVRYDLEPRPGPFLAITLPGPVEIPWSLVDGMLQPVLRDGPGHWLVPLGDRQARRVDLIWHRPAIAYRDESPEPLALPSLPGGRVPTLVRIYGAPSLSIASRGPELEKLEQGSALIEMAERSGSRISAGLDRLDRNSTTERDQLIEEIVELELMTRSCSRKSESLTGSFGNGFDRIKKVLASVEEAFELAGYLDIFEEAQNRVGLFRDFEHSSKAVPGNSSEMIRVRRIGVPSSFRSRNDSAGEFSSLTLTRTPLASTSNVLVRWEILVVGLGLSLACGRRVGQPIVRNRRLLGVVGMLIIGLGLAWEPLGSTAIVILMGLGRSAD